MGVNYVSPKFLEKGRVHLLDFDTATTIAVLVGVVLPALVALVTKQVASPRVKSIALIALSAAAAVLTPLLGADAVDVETVFISFLTIFGTAILSYYGILKPTGITEGIASKVPGGIGADPALPGYDEIDESKADDWNPQPTQLPADLETPEPVDLPEDDAQNG